MIRTKKIKTIFLVELLALLFSVLFLFSCEEEDPLPDNKKEILESILKDASQRTGVTYYDLITEFNLKGSLYYEVYSGVCYPGFPVYYSSTGEFLCSDHFWDEKEFQCNAEFKNLDYARSEVVYSEADHCLGATAINKYNIEPANSCEGQEVYQSSY